LVGAWVLLVSTHQVFDGVAPPYAPDNSTSPVDVHGRSKAEAEKLLVEV
jgi:dTDP-4-dehydrorhamnose reductase